VRRLDSAKRVVAANFESRHYTEQLIQRLGYTHRHGGNGLSTSAVALDWYDITDQTITAAAYPEPARA
jgi:hypothetical protein